MNFGPFVFIGAFCTMLISWATFVFSPQLQIGSIQPATTVPNGDNYPAYRTGAQKRGLDVYRANNCAACHTQMIRPAGLGPDLTRPEHWALPNRFSVAEDYLYDYPVMLGTQRVGPDLANAGSRIDQRIVLLKLYNPANLVANSVMPPYPFLFKKQKIGRNSSPDALPVKVEEGYEVVPTDDAKALAAYIASLNQNAYIFEVPPPPKEKPITMHPVTKSPATPTPAK